MHAHDHQNTHDHPAPSAPQTSNRVRAKWVFIGFLAISAFFLVAEHRAHLFGFLPWLILLACPLMHIFMHRGHGHGGHSHSADSNGRDGEGR